MLRFSQKDIELIDIIIKDYTGGFTIVLDGLKAFLEHHVNLNFNKGQISKRGFSTGKIKAASNDVVGKGFR